MKVLVLVIAILGVAAAAFGQQKALNIPGIHQLVSDSKSEHGRQSEARDKQAVNSINEEVNRTMLARLKNTYRSLQSRFSVVGTAIDLLDIGTRAGPMASQIVQDQMRLYELAESKPALLPMVLQSEVDLLERSRDLIYYLAGLTASLGAVNQMKASDRRILFDYVISEIAALRNLSAGMVRTLEYGSLSSMVQSANPFSAYINMDRAIVKEILENAKYLKK